jgi:hypothetical protein
MGKRGCGWGWFGIAETGKSHSHRWGFLCPRIRARGGTQAAPPRPHNYLLGTLPNELCACVALEEERLEHNKLRGAVSAQLRDSVYTSSV